MRRIGIHVGQEDIENSIIKVKKNGGNIIQLFVNISNKEKYYKLASFLKKHNMKSIVHISYTINCCKNWSEYSWWIVQFIEEIKCAAILESAYVVIHLGKQLELSKEEALNNMYSSLIYVNARTIELDLSILIETSTGQGSEICYKIEDLAHFYRKILTHRNDKVKNRIKICVDTCHIFCAGYDIRNKNTIEQYLDNFNELIGLENIKLIHLNDSKNDIGSNVDRHENLGFGYIGCKSLIYFINRLNKLNPIIILETPHDRIYEDLKKIN